MSVLYFAALRELAGTGRQTLELSQRPATVQTLVTLLQSRSPGLRGRLGSVRVAVNEAFVDSDHLLQDGDTVALIPPVSGG